VRFLQQKNCQNLGPSRCILPCCQLLGLRRARSHCVLLGKAGQTGLTFLLVTSSGWVAWFFGAAVLAVYIIFALALYGLSPKTHA